jgi:L-aspartate oxidase
MIRTPIESRRYLAELDTQALGHLFTDCLIIGGGVAGLRAALELAPQHKVIVLAKEGLSDSNTYHAQGGIAVVLDPGDSFEDHVRDTLTTGSGLSDRDVVDFVVRHGPEQIRQLQQWSLPFDKENGRLAMGREGGHSAARVVHALGHATGKAVASTLLDEARRRKRLKIFDHCFAIDLLTEGNVCHGAFTHHPKFGYQCIWARCVILATGGAGQLWRETTNPAGATADGIALAYRAGATLRDLEFMQFHPTTLYVAGAGRTLITEALRGAGAKLVDRYGRQFMQEYHPMGELAPRDVVSRAIYQQISATGATNVYLDLRHLGAAWLAREFPEIAQLCASFDLDPDTDLIPVRPSAHYLVGGVRADVHGRTDVERLYCIGESASSGLHGANRLASNSLLEGLVFGQEAGRHLASLIAAETGPVPSLNISYTIEPSPRTPLDIPDVTNSLRAVMWRNCGIERNEERLAETLDIIDFWRRYVMDKVFDSPAGWELQNMLTVGRLVADAARQRRESRGTHFRTDFPEQNDAEFLRHIEIAAKH